MPAKLNPPGLCDVVAVEVNPQQAVSLYALALAQLQNGEAAAAGQTLQELTLLRPGDAAVLHLQAAALALRQPGLVVHGRIYF